MSFDSENDDNDSGRRLRFLKSLQPEVSQFILENEVCEFIRFKFTLEMSGIAAIAIYQSQRRNLHMEDHLIELQRLKAGNPNIALFMLDACEAHAEEIFVYLNGLEEKYCLKDGLPLYNDTDCYPLYWLIKKNEAPRICAGSTRDSMRALRMHFGLSLKGSELPKCKYGTPSISEPGSSAHQRDEVDANEDLSLASALSNPILSYTQFDNGLVRDRDPNAALTNIFTKPVNEYTLPIEIDEQYQDIPQNGDFPLGDFQKASNAVERELNVHRSKRKRRRHAREPSTAKRPCKDSTIRNTSSYFATVLSHPHYEEENINHYQPSSISEARAERIVPP